MSLQGCCNIHALRPLCYLVNSLGKKQHQTRGHACDVRASNSSQSLGGWQAVEREKRHLYPNWITTYVKP